MICPLERVVLISRPSLANVTLLANPWQDLYAQHNWAFIRIGYRKQRITTVEPYWFKINLIVLIDYLESIAFYSVCTYFLANM